MTDATQERIEALEDRAGHVRDLLRYASRAFVVEFCGTPKAGKSTAVEAIRHFFARNGMRVHVLQERAERCPIPMKGHLFFNTWCASSSLAEFLEVVEAEADVLLVDRGLFDALVWLTLQENRGEVTSEEVAGISNFLLLERWRRLTDLVLVMSAQPETAIQRELDARISARPGSIMNPRVLQAIAEALRNTLDRYQDRFHSVEHLDTTGQSPRETNEQIAGHVLGGMEGMLNPEVLVISRAHLRAWWNGTEGVFSPCDDERVAALLDGAKYIRRSIAEQDDDHVQIVPAAVLTVEDQLFFFRRRESDPKYRLYGKDTVFQGCHVARRDGMSADPVRAAEQALREKLSRLLFLGRELPGGVIGVAWDNAADEEHSRHVGLIVRKTIENPETAHALRKKEFRSRRAPWMIGELIKPRDLLAAKETFLEPWSRGILQDCEDWW